MRIIVELSTDYFSFINYCQSSLRSSSLSTYLLALQTVVYIFAYFLGTFLVYNALKISFKVQLRLQDLLALY